MIKSNATHRVVDMQRANLFAVSRKAGYVVGAQYLRYLSGLLRLLGLDPAQDAVTADYVGRYVRFAQLG